jgi:hypothetical protein
MRSISAAVLLDIWERGQALPPAHRALLLLQAADPTASSESLRQLSVGTRDMRLMRLREHLMGRRIEGVVACPACGDQLELQVPIDRFRAEMADRADQDGGGRAHSESLTVTEAGHTVRFRVPTAGDLVAVLDGNAVGPDDLLRRCVLEAHRNETPIAVDELPASVVSTMSERMAAEDPMARVQLALACPGCEHHWDALFDIVAYLWAEVEDWARRMLRSVHVLASAYGWSEADILAMSTPRRQWYLSLVHG